MYNRADESARRANPASSYGARAVLSSSSRKCLDICLSSIVIEVCFTALMAFALVKRQVPVKRRNFV